MRRPDWSGCKDPRSNCTSGTRSFPQSEDQIEIGPRVPYACYAAAVESGRYDSPVSSRWECISHIPRIKNLPVAGTTLAPDGGFAPGVIAAITPPASIVRRSSKDMNTVTPIISTSAYREAQVQQHDAGPGGGLQAALVGELVVFCEKASFICPLLWVGQKRASLPRPAVLPPTCAHRTARQCAGK